MEEVQCIVIGRTVPVPGRSKNEPVIHLEIGGEEDPVRMPGKQPTHALRIVSSQFGNPCCKIRVEVGIPLHLLVHPVDVLGIAHEMDRYKWGLRMAFNNPKQRGEQFLTRGKLLGIPKPPTLVILQLPPPLVLRVVGQLLKKERIDA